jgi:hypothetical protein
MKKMIEERKKLLIVGDNPFHGISHLSQERARARGNKVTQTDYAADLVLTSLENGADGFMFSVSETTLTALRTISEKIGRKDIALYAIVPYAYEYVRLATHLGTLGLAKKLGWEIASSRNIKAISLGLRGLMGMDLGSLMKTYLIYEISRIKKFVGKRHNLESVILHEIVTDMALALDLEWLFMTYVEFISKLKIQPGFETRNYPHLMRKFKQWNLDLNKMTIVTSFNKVGFQMNPSKIECEKAIADAPASNVIAMSVLAAGYLGLPEAVEYIEGLPNLKGMVIGVSKKKHAHETFSFLRNRFSDQSRI